MPGMLSRHSLVSLVFLLAGCAGNQQAETLVDDNASAAGEKNADAGGGTQKPSNGGEPVGAQSGGDGGSGPANVCEARDIAATANPPDMLIILDRSASMEVDTVNLVTVQTMRWMPAVAAVKEVTAALEDTIRFGLMVFPNEASGCSSGLLEVPMDLNTAGSIATKLDGHKPGGATPLSITLRGAQNELLSSRNVVDALPRDQYILLITDGAPNCSASLSSSQALDDQDAYKAVDGLRTNGVKTYVIGFDTGGLTVLDELARRGGTGETTHRKVSDGSTLVAELENISARVVSCSYELAKAPGDPTYVRVAIDGKSYPLGDAGWKLEGDTTVQLQPAACDVLQDGKSHAIKITVECDPVVVF